MNKISNWSASFSAKQSIEMEEVKRVVTWYCEIE